MPFIGNAGEQLAGDILVNAADASCILASEGAAAEDNSEVAGNLMLEESILTEITLNCGSGVELGAKAKSFYIGLLPQTFEQGITVEVECGNGTSTTKSTAGKLVVERNHIVPMESFKYDGVLPEAYELAYTTNDGKALDPYTTEGFGGEFMENIYDAATGRGVLKFAGAVTTIPEQAFAICENLTWIDLPEGITTIGASAFTGCTALEELTIPSTLTSLGSEAFKNCSFKATINCENISFSGAGFTEVIIGDSVTTIGSRAFNSCDSLTSVTIGDSVTTIGYMAFYNCYSLRSVTIPDSVTTIGEAAFHYCRSLTSVTIPDSVKTIGNSAFYNCDSLKSVTIPNSVTTIGNSAFWDCDSLTSVTIPDSVTTIGNSAFEDCYSLTSVYCKATTPPAGGGDMFNTSDIIYIPEGSLRAYKMAENWSEYADCFVEYDYNSTVTISYTTSDGMPVDAHAPIASNSYQNGVGELKYFGKDIIPAYLFYKCDNLTSVTIPDSVTTIGNSAFYDCSNLTSVYCKATTPPTLGSNVFKTYNNGYVNLGCAIYVPAESVETYKAAENWSSYKSRIVGYDVETGEVFVSQIKYTSTTKVETYTPSAFNVAIISNGWDETTSEGVITFNGELTTIGDKAFYYCRSLTSVTIPDSVTTIGNEAFYQCHSLTSVTIPDSVTTIGDYAFYYCTSLTSVTIPDSVTTIGEGAFYYCSSLTIVYCKATTPPTLSYDTFYALPNACQIYVPTESEDVYKEDAGWSKYAAKIVGYIE